MKSRLSWWRAWVGLGMSLCAGAVLAGDRFEGTWVCQSPGITLTLQFQEDAQGNLAGSLTGKAGYRLQLEGLIQDGVGVGTCRDAQGTVFFEAHLSESQLDLYLLEPDSNNMPDANRARKLTFLRQGGVDAPPPPPAGAPAPGRARLPMPGGQPMEPPPSAAPATPSPPPVAAGGGQRVSDAQLGFSFVPPAGWKVQKQAQGYILGHDTLKGFILIAPHNFNSLEQIQAEAGQGLVDAQSGIQLMPTGSFQPLGANGLAAEFSGTFQGQAARAYAVGLLAPGGGGVTILTATVADAYTPDHAQAVQAIAGSMTFAAPQSDTALMQWIAGKYWTYSGSGGYSSERTVHLCPDGRYYDSAESSASGSFDNRASGSDWGTASQSRGSARWTIRGTRQQGVITLTYADGTRMEVAYQATGEQGVFMIEGRKYAYAGPANCN
jgi:hypothetical protein